MRTPDEYREFAAECYRWAAEAKTEMYQKMMEEMARAWSEVVEELEQRLLSNDEARRIAANIARLPELVGRRALTSIKVPLRGRGHHARNPNYSYARPSGACCGPVVGLSLTEAHRIAANIAKLPELVRKPQSERGGCCQPSKCVNSCPPASILLSAISWVFASKSQVLARTSHAHLFWLSSPRFALRRHSLASMRLSLLSDIAAMMIQKVYLFLSDCRSAARRVAIHHAH
jgi:hypothetical protein